MVGRSARLAGAGSTQGDQAGRTGAGDTDRTRTEEAAARAALIDCALRMNALGINQGKSGNVSVRWRGPDGREGMLVTPSGLPYADTEPHHLAWMPLEACDERDAVGPLAPSSEWRFHRDIYAHRADAGAIVHTHAPHATALACLPRVQRDGIPAFHYMVAMTGGERIGCARYETFGTQALSDAVIDSLGARRACLLANHGMIALGSTLEAALALAVEVESLARMYALALSLGEPVVLPADEMARVLERFRTYGKQRAGGQQAL